ncbi:prenyltransferase [Natrialba aegyptia]|uniref:Prenyltransferase n=1 Tax=Natrialba aegyptia DSM 13077 TaxID=1227491 RepID=M0B4G4_9EURY|nr:prenyltransferase [Natrialba aegyptia]ELZ04514.1 prenyltransferase [Natrialba aegyptia DSM 13077]
MTDSSSPGCGDGGEQSDDGSDSDAAGPAVRTPRDERPRTGGKSELVDCLSHVLVLSRPRFWLYLAGPVLVGVAYAADAVGELFTPAAVVLFAYFLVPANVFLYGINDIYDREIDAENPKKDADEREARYRGQRYVPVVVGLCAALPLLFVPLLPTAAWPWLVAFLVLGAAYSAPPIRFKTTPPLDSVSNGLYVAPGAAAYAAVAGTQPPLTAVAGGWLWAMGMHTFSAMPDIAPDREAGVRTTATVLGETWTAVYCGACWLASAAAFGSLDARLGLVLLVYPALISVLAATRIDVRRAYWWFPLINTAVGTVLTMGGLWRLLHG